MDSALRRFLFWRVENLSVEGVEGRLPAQSCLKEFDSMIQTITMSDAASHINLEYTMCLTRHCAWHLLLRGKKC
jgi:hypothetical protein